MSAAAFALPAVAQFGPIFGGPPRPPADIPGGRRPPATIATKERRVRPIAVDALGRRWSRRRRRVTAATRLSAAGISTAAAGYPQQAGRPPAEFSSRIAPPPGFPNAPPGQQPGQQAKGVNPTLPGFRRPASATGTPGDTPPTPAPPNDEVVIAPPAQKIRTTKRRSSGSTRSPAASSRSMSRSTKRSSSAPCR